jgi:hypothetical protein
MPIVHRRQAIRCEMPATLGASEGTESHRHIGRPVGSRADCRDLGAHGSGDMGKTRRIAGLALIGAHSKGGITLDVLDRPVALPHGQRDVRIGHIALQVDEAFALAPGSLGDAPDRCGRNRFGIRGQCQVDFSACGKPRCRCRLGARRRAFGHASNEREGAARRPGGSLRLHRGARDEGSNPWVKVGSATRLRVKVNSRIPAAGYTEKVAVDAAKLSKPLSRTIEVATLEQLLHALQLAHCRPSASSATSIADPLRAVCTRALFRT